MVRTLYTYLRGVQTERIREGIVRELDVPRARKTIHHSLLPADDRVDNVLVGQGGGEQGHQVVLGYAPPQPQPVHLPQPGTGVYIFR